LYGVFAIALGYLVSTRITNVGITFGAILTKRLTILFVMLFLVVGALVVIGLSDEIVSRFVGDNAISSDFQRAEMYFPLIEKYVQYPILGVGMGGYTEELIRVERLPWNYELQWLAFTMQFGIFGVFFLALTALLPMFVYFKNSFSYGAILIMYVLWIGVGFFNSFLITSASGVVYSAYIALGRFINNR
jgi:hypothetical protein